MQKTFFGLPDWDEVYKKVVAYVKQHQGEKGYIITYDEAGHDSPWVMYYAGYDSAFWEAEVQAVRVNHNSLQVLYERDADEINDEDIPQVNDSDWEDVWGGAVVCPISTLISIAEEIQYWA